MKNKRLVFMNSGMHFWNREKEAARFLGDAFAAHLPTPP